MLGLSLDLERRRRRNFFYRKEGGQDYGSHGWLKREPSLYEGRRGAPSSERHATLPKAAPGS